MPGVGFHYWNDARNKPGGLVGIGPLTNQYNGFLDVLHTSGEVFYAFDYPELFAVPSNSLSGLFSSVTLPSSIVVQLLNQGVSTHSAFINLATNSSSSSISLGADFITFQSGGSTVPVPFPPALDENFLVNGNMDIWQRGTSFTSTGYTADRWRFTKGASDNLVSQAGNPPVGSNFAVRLQRPNLSVNTAQSLLEQGGESVNCTRLLGVVMTVSFWYRAGANYSGGGETVTVYGGTGTDEPSPFVYTGRSTLGSVNITPTTAWQQAFFQIRATGSVNEFGITLTKTNSGTAGADDFLDYAQLQIGSSGVEDQGLALLRCQRYFQRFNPNGVAFLFYGVGYSYAANSGLVNLYLPVPLRKQPVATTVGTFEIFTNLAINCTPTVTSNRCGPSVIRVDFTVAAGLAAGVPLFMEDRGLGSGDFLLDAEL